MTTLASTSSLPRISPGVIRKKSTGLGQIGNQHSFPHRVMLAACLKKFWLAVTQLETPATVDSTMKSLARGFVTPRPRMRTTTTATRIRPTIGKMALITSLTRKNMPSPTDRRCKLHRSKLSTEVVAASNTAFSLFCSNFIQSYFSLLQ